MNKIKLLVLIAIIITSAQRISAQDLVTKPLTVCITSQMQMRMHGNPDASFHLPASFKQGRIEKSGAVQIDVQSNRDWMLQVKTLNVSNATNTGIMPSGSLRIRADGQSFISLDQNEINLIKGSKGSYKSIGHSLSVDYELTFKNNTTTNTFQIDLLYTLVAI